MKMPREGSVLGEVSAGVVTACLTVPLCVPAGILAYAPLGPDYVAKGAVAGLVCAIAGGITAAVFRRSSFVATFPTTPISVILGSFVLALATASHGDLRITAAAALRRVRLDLRRQPVRRAAGHEPWEGRPEGLAVERPRELVERFERDGGLRERLGGGDVGAVTAQPVSEGVLAVRLRTADSRARDSFPGFPGSRCVSDTR